MKEFCHIPQHPIDRDCLLKLLFDWVCENEDREAIETMNSISIYTLDKRILMINIELI
jgi:hypothetical protein